MDLDTKSTLLLEKLIYCDFRTTVGTEQAKKHIRHALRIQDRDSRHACAEAVLNCRYVCETPAGNDAISPDDAHQACMNVKAV